MTKKLHVADKWFTFLINTIGVVFISSLAGYGFIFYCKLFDTVNIMASIFVGMMLTGLVAMSYTILLQNSQKVTKGEKQ